MSRMFEDADSFNQPLNNWDVENVTNMSNMFEMQAALIKIYRLGVWNILPPAYKFRYKFSCKLNC